MNDLEPLSGGNLHKHDLVFRDILDAIRRGKLAPGQRLPNEFQLAARYAVSRNSVRRGLMRLQDQGVVEKRRGSGSYVSLSARGEPAREAGTTLAIRFMPASTQSLIGQSSGPWWVPLREGMAYGAAYHGVQILDEPHEAVPHTTPGIPSEHLGGVLAVAFGKDEPSDLLSDVPAHVPSLLVNRSPEGFDVASITIDRMRGAYEATSFLLRLGHTRIAFDVLGATTQPIRERQRGYRQAFKESGLPVDESLLFVGAVGPAYLEWPQRLHAMLRKSPRPTAMILHHDNRVLHVMEILNSHGLRVPQDLSLIIIDDDPVLARLTPRLSAIREPYGEMGRRAIAMAMQIRRGALDVRNVSLEPQLIMRDSVLPLK